MQKNNVKNLAIKITQNFLQDFHEKNNAKKMRKLTVLWTDSQKLKKIDSEIKFSSSNIY